jgi:site-specific DNA-methyltransferase (adenine-specific)
MGSGTTGAACIVTKRQFIGVEKNEMFFEMALQRLKGNKFSDIKI